METFFALHIFAFNDFGISIYLRPRPISEFGVQHAIEFNTLIHCPNMVKKLAMYVGPHDVYPTIDVNFSILTRECKNKKLVDNIFSSNFVLLSMC